MPCLLTAGLPHVARQVTRCAATSARRAGTGTAHGYTCAACHASIDLWVPGGTPARLGTEDCGRQQAGSRASRRAAAAALGAQYAGTALSRTHTVALLHQGCCCCRHAVWAGALAHVWNAAGALQDASAAGMAQLLWHSNPMQGSPTQSPHLPPAWTGTPGQPYQRPSSSEPQPSESSSSTSCGAPCACAHCSTS